MTAGLGKKKPRIYRDWEQARAKCEAEQGCRVCGEWPVESAHIIGREHDANFPIRSEDWSPYDVAPDRIVPLCPAHHRQYDALNLDLGSYLTDHEQAQAVMDACGIHSALYRLWPLSENPRRVA